MKLACAKILIGFISENVCYLSVNNMLPSNVSPKNIKIKININSILPVFFILVELAILY
jgi:hypothetical protein